jgi:hypothetical protein
MDLGNILARDGNTPLSGRLVKFTVQAQAEGVLVSALASARLIPLTADDQRTVRSEAVAFVYATDEDGKRLRPKLGDGDVEEEFVWRWLAKVLRDEEDVKKPFATSTRLRQCLIVKQVEFLQLEYNLMLVDHYPELVGLIPTGSREGIVGAAAGHF